jgi:hypothetical protein
MGLPARKILLTATPPGDPILALTKLSRSPSQPLQKARPNKRRSPGSHGGPMPLVHKGHQPAVRTRTLAHNGAGPSLHRPVLCSLIEAAAIAADGPPIREMAEEALDL